MGIKRELAWDQTCYLMICSTYSPLLPIMMPSKRMCKMW